MNSVAQETDEVIEYGWKDSRDTSPIPSPEALSNNIPAGRFLYIYFFNFNKEEERLEDQIHRNDLFSMVY